MRQLGRLECALGRLAAARHLASSSEASRKLSEELRRGYFDDLRELRVAGGKRHLAPTALKPAASTALVFPESTLRLVDERNAATALPDGPCALSLVFRAGATQAAATWTPSLLELQPALPFVQLSLVESFLFALPGLRQLLLRSGATPPLEQRAGRHAFCFGNAEPLRLALGLENRLVCHILLLDRARRLRWAASGPATVPEEHSALRDCGEKLLQEDKRSSAC
jgi:hypothetical protein